MTPIDAMKAAYAALTTATPSDKLSYGIVMMIMMFAYIISMMQATITSLKYLFLSTPIEHHDD